MAQVCDQCRSKLPRGEAGPICSSCRAKIAAAEQREAGVIAAQAKYDERLAAYSANALATIDAAVGAGGTSFLYRTVHLDVDSLMEEQRPSSGMDLFDLNHSGALGWEVVASIPRTYSGSQTYVAKNKVTATSFGGGSTVQRVSLSGNVVGTYVLMKLAITSMNRAPLDEWIRRILADSAKERLGARPAL